MFYITDLIIIGFTYLFMTSFEQSLHYLSHNRKYGGHIYIYGINYIILIIRLIDYKVKNILIQEVIS